MMFESRQTATASLLTACLCTPLLVQADPLEGNKSIYLIDKQGVAIQVGHIDFQPQNGQIQYQLKMDHQGKFKDYFLSMKEMKCLEGPELMCHLAYPYQQPHQVSADDMSWLSHDLLFMYKKPAEFGANFWNGIYYQLSVEGDVIKGEAKAVDLNLLASPPDDLTQPPFGEFEREDLDPKLRWLPLLEIR